jgi:phosphoserine phosphatase
MESVLMTIPPAFCANSSARADLPLAVGPAISTALLKPNEFACMSLVATLICNPANPALDTTIVDGALAVLPRPARRNGCSTKWQSTFPSTIRSRARTTSRRSKPACKRRAAISRSTLSCSLSAVRRKKLFLADMDSTMIGQECIDELADFAGLKAHVAAITERAMRGEIEFEPALRERVALLKDLPVSVVDEVLAKRITPTPGGRELVMTMRANGAYTCLISGGFTLFTHAVAAKIGFQENRANELGSRRQVHRRSGRADPRPRHQAGNADRASRILRPRRNRHAGDRRRRQRSRHDPGGGLGVAYHAKPAVAAAAAARIDYGDLTALLVCAGLSARRVRGLIEIGLLLTPAT